MSRSYLKYKEDQRNYGEPSENPHKRDEMPRNHASRYINSRCSNVEWIQEPGSFSGHKPTPGGHRIVSGIVRSKEKEEIRKEIEDGIK